MIARLVLIATLVLLVAAPSSVLAEAAPGQLAAEVALGDDAPAPSPDDACFGPYHLAAPPPNSAAASSRFADAAVPRGPSLARVFRPPRLAA
jgi:hypothetical protein